VIELYGRVICDALDPPVGGTFVLEISLMPPLPKTCPKNGFCPEKGVAFLTETVLKKNFQVPERVPLSALVPAHMAAPLPGEAARGLTGPVTPPASGSWPAAR
jgi:hypothetical protein